MSTDMIPAFSSMVRSSGLGEVWTHHRDDLKFTQFGWRCTNTENSYTNDTLVGNWNEERFDIRKQSAARRLPSQYNHYFETTYGKCYDKGPQDVPKELKHLKERQPHSHPCHQPELDQPELKSIYNSWETTSRAAYPDRRIRTAPLQTPPSDRPTCQSQNQCTSYIPMKEAI